INHTNKLRLSVWKEDQSTIEQKMTTGEDQVKPRKTQGESQRRRRSYIAGYQSRIVP
ncbi:hypothetical protein Bca52824_025406, partial [Brassica carinata]